MSVSAANDETEALTANDRSRLSRLSRLPAAWTGSVRSRRLLVVGLSAPGFLATFATPFHQNSGLLLAGLAAFAAALIFRVRTESLFLRAAKAGAWPPATLDPRLRETSHA